MGRSRGVRQASQTGESLARAAAERDQLGQFQRSYHGGFRMSVVLMIVLAATLTLCGPGQLLVSASTDVIVILGLLDVAFIAITIWVWRREHQHSNDDIYLFENGLVHIDRSGNVTSYPWTTVSQVRARKMDLDIEGIPLPPVHFIKAIRADGASVMLNNRFNGVAALGAIVQQEVTAAQLPRAIGDLQAGQAINFDGLAVDRQGLRHKRGTVSWSDVVSIATAEGVTSTKVSVRTRGRRAAYTWRLVPSRPFPNHWLLVNLARTLGTH